MAAKQAKQYFPTVPHVGFEGLDSKNPFAFKQYNPDQIVAGKAMKNHLRFAMAYWHSMRGEGGDPFGPGTVSYRSYDSQSAERAAVDRMRAAFEFMDKLGIDFYCFHDRDIVDEAGNLAETNKRLDKMADRLEVIQQDYGKKLLWGTTNAFSNPRFMSGAGTNPRVEAFAYAAAQVKKAMEVTAKLGGEGYVFWGGREGYDTLLNTDMKRELEHLAAFMHGAVAHKKDIGFTGQFYIEPKPMEPTKHQYDFDAATVISFLIANNLADDFKLNIEANHATLAGHDFQHDLVVAADNGMLGSVDANRVDSNNGWDTDQFPTDIYQTTLAMLPILKMGGFTTGGLNFDAKVRRQSNTPEDLALAHIGAMDAFAFGLKVANRLIEDRALDSFIEERYATWDHDAMGQEIERNGVADFEALEKYTLTNGEVRPESGRQEQLENVLNQYIWTTH